MKNKIIIILITLLFFTSCDEINNKNYERYKIENWKYQGQDLNWRKLIFPESIINTLFRDTIIKTIYFDKPNLHTTLIDTTNWQYKATINITDDILNGKYELYLYGIVGMADIYLNNQYIGQTEDMFISQKIDITQIIKKGNNTILFKFLNYKEWMKYYRTLTKSKLPLKGREMMRLPYYYTDDNLGMSFVPLGFQENFYVQRWQKAIIRDVKYSLLLLKNESLAKIRATYTIDAEEKKEATLTISLKNKTIAEKNIKLRKGTNIVSIDFQIDKPKLWWTYDMGEPYLYNFVSTLKINKKNISKIKKKYGIREITIDTSNNNFELRLNGLPVTLKIINYIRPTLLKEKMPSNSYKKYVTDFVLAGINMVHVDEKGLYETEEFYNQCDRQGILVWQDFMLPYKAFPSNKQYNVILKKEIQQQIARISNHPCLAFWSGQNFYNNYIKKISPKDSTTYLNSNKKLFKNTISNLVKEYDQRLYYFEKMNFRNIVYIKDTIPEYPTIITYRSAINKKMRYIGSKMNIYHSRPKNADMIISKKIEDYFKYKPQDITQQIYLSNLMKKEIFEKKLFDMRILDFKGYIAGNYADFSPIISNSAVDFKEKWKGKMYAIKNAMSKILINITKNKGWVKIAIKSEKFEDINADCYFILYDFNGKSFWRRNYLNTTIYKSSYISYFEFNLTRELSIIKPNNAVFVMQIYSNQELIAEKTFLFVPSYALNLKPPIITKKFYRVDDGYVIELNTDYFAYGVYLHTEKNGILTDNYLNLIPGQPKKIKFLTPQDIFGVESAFKTIDFTMKNKKLLFNFNN